METRASYAIVGTFVLSMIAALFAFIIFIAKVQFDQVSVPYYVYFSGSVTGLEDGSSVRLRGVPIGVVDDIRIAPEDPALVRVRVQVGSDTIISQDAVATIEMQGITGIAYIQVTGGRKESPPIERRMGEIAVIPSKPSQISEFIDAAPQVLNRLIHVTELLEKFLSDDNAQNVAQIIGNTRVFSEDLSKANFAEVAAALNKVSQQMVAVLSENRGPIRDFTGGGLYELSLMIGDMRELSASLRRLVAQIERDPSGFLLAGPRKGVEAK